MSQTPTFNIVLRAEPEGGYTVRVPALPIVTFGDDETHALAMAKEAIELAIEVRTERGEPIPMATDVPIREVTVTLPSAA